MTADTTREAQADRLIIDALDALSRADGEAMAALVSPDVVITTDRKILQGADEAREWAAKRYDHLDRRYRIKAFAHSDGASVVDALVEYSWRGETEISDSSPVRFHFVIAGGLISRIELED